MKEVGFCLSVSATLLNHLGSKMCLTLKTDEYTHIATSNTELVDGVLVRKRAGETRVYFFQMTLSPSRSVKTHGLKEQLRKIGFFVTMTGITIACL